MRSFRLFARPSLAITLLGSASGIAIGAVLAGSVLVFMDEIAWLSLFIGSTLAPPFKKLLGEQGEQIAMYLSFVAYIFICGPSGVVLGRFVLRGFPPRASGTRRWPILITLLVYWGWLIFTIATGEAIQGGEIARFTLGLYLNVGAIGVPLWRHAFPRAFLRRPFVVFLRRFSSFSDREVITELIKAVPPGTPMVLMTPRVTYPRDWSPRVIGFAGLTPWRPFSRIPVFLWAPDEKWTDSARQLIAWATVIVLDLSESSEAMQLEYEMITRAARWPDVVILTNADDADRYARSAMLPEGPAVIAYSKRWRFGLRRMAMGLLGLTALALIVLDQTGAGIFSIVSGYGFWWEDGEFTYWKVRLAVLTVVLLGLAAFALFFWGQGIDLPSRRRLREAVRIRLNDSGARPT